MNAIPINENETIAETLVRHEFEMSNKKDSVAYWQSEGFVLVHKDDVREAIEWLPKNNARELIERLEEALS